MDEPGFTPWYIEVQAVLKPLESELEELDQDDPESMYFIYICTKDDELIEKKIVSLEYYYHLRFTIYFIMTINVSLFIYLFSQIYVIFTYFTVFRGKKAKRRGGEKTHQRKRLRYCNMIAVSILKYQYHEN